MVPIALALSICTENAKSIHGEIHLDVANPMNKINIYSKSNIKFYLMSIEQTDEPSGMHHTRESFPVAICRPALFSAQFPKR